MNLIIYLLDFEKVGFRNLSGSEVSRISHEIANSERVKVKNKTFDCKKIDRIEISR